MKNETKLKKLILWLDDNNIKHEVPTEPHGSHVMKPDLIVWATDDLHIHVMIDNGDAELVEKFFNEYKSLAPFFIRSSETPSYILEKMQNTIIKLMKKQMVLDEKRKKREV